MTSEPTSVVWRGNHYVHYFKYYLWKDHYMLKKYLIIFINFQKYEKIKFTQNLNFSFGIHLKNWEYVRKTKILIWFYNY